jgi:hypothetical protein
MRDGSTEPRIPVAAPAPDPDRTRDFMRFARAAYDAYVRGMPLDVAAGMPPWELLADRGKEAWADAARGVIIEQAREV